MVETRRFELLTPCLQGRCSPQLSYAPHEWLRFSIDNPFRRIRYLFKVIPMFSSFLSVLYTMCISSNMSQLVGLGGLEPPTSRLSGVRSNQLSYRPISVELRVFTDLSKPNNVRRTKVST